MKKIIVFVIMIIPALNLHAQQKPVHKPVSPVEQKPQLPEEWFGIFAGTHLNFLGYYDKSTTIEGKNASFHAGIFYQKNFNKYFALQPSLLFSIRGGKIRNIDSTINASLMNIELPINFLYIYKHLMIGAGPNFWYGINGKFKSNGTERNAYNVEESLERTLKRFEFGGNFMIAYTFKKMIFISANFSPDFINMYKGDGSAPPNVKARTRMFGISLGYRFGISNGE